LNAQISKIKDAIIAGKTVLGIELGSTRIKAVLIDEDNKPIATGNCEWSNSYEDGIWTYNLEDAIVGLQTSYKHLADNVLSKYEVLIDLVGAIGISGMMHGYIVFDKNDELLVPFRTWRNNITDKASKELTQLFQYQIPQRWSIAHLHQSILNGENHVSEINYMTTLAGYVHWLLSGEKVLGVGDVSGMFPIDLETKTYNKRMLNLFDELVEEKRFEWHLEYIMPKPLVAGEKAGKLSGEGAILLDPSGTLKPGIPMCPPEGDAGTGMVATNSVAERTANVSAGTSIFAMVVLEKSLTKVYPELDMVTTPTGSLVAMVHSNNCTSNLDAWVNLFDELLLSFGLSTDKNNLYNILYNKALEGDADCGGLLAYGYLSGEHMTHFEEGRPLFLWSSESRFNLANFIRVNLQTSLGAIKIGLDLLMEKEGVKIDKMMGHGGLFKTPGVGQRFMAAVVEAPVEVVDNAGEGGAWGIALLAAYLVNKKQDETLSEFLNNRIFSTIEGVIIMPVKEDVDGFKLFMERYKAGLPIERAAIDNFRPQN
jgi:sugar (pentulose or hexulose) kinase